MGRKISPAKRALLDQTLADFRDTVMAMADESVPGHSRDCDCNSTLCPGPKVLTFLQMAGPPTVLALAGVAIRLLGEERAKRNGE